MDDIAARIRLLERWGKFSPLENSSGQKCGRMRKIYFCEVKHLSE